MYFVVPGTSQHGFHLVHVRQVATAGSGGEITWKDSIWNRDRINLTGVMFEVAEDAIQHPLTRRTEQEDEVARQALMQDFHRRLVSKFQSIEAGLQKAFGLQPTAEINFTQFVAGCRQLGYPGHMTKLWSLLDEDQSGLVSFEELQSCEQEFKISILDKEPPMEPPLARALEQPRQIAG